MFKYDFVGPSEISTFAQFIIRIDSRGTANLTENNTNQRGLLFITDEVGSLHHVTSAGFIRAVACHQLIFLNRLPWLVHFVSTHHPPTATYPPIKSPHPPLDATALTCVVLQTILSRRNEVDVLCAMHNELKNGRCHRMREVRSPQATERRSGGGRGREDWGDGWGSRRGRLGAEMTWRCRLTS